MPWLPWVKNTVKTARDASPVKKQKIIKPVKAPNPLNSSRRLPEHGKDCNAATKQHNPFHLLSIPAHLRAEIIRLVVVESEQGKITVDDNNQMLCEQPGIARACWDLRMDALPIFYSENQFVVEVRRYDIDAVLGWWKMVQSLRDRGVVVQFSKMLDGAIVPEERKAISYRQPEMPHLLGKELPKKREDEKDDVEFLTSKESSATVDTEYYETTDPRAKKGSGWVILRKIPAHESPDLTDEQRKYIDAYHARDEPAASWLAQVKTPTRITIRVDGQPDWQNLEHWLELVHKKEVAPLTYEDIDNSEDAGTVKAIFDGVVRFQPYPLEIAMLASDSWRHALVDRDARWGDDTPKQSAPAVMEESDDGAEPGEPIGLLTMGEDTGEHNAEHPDSEQVDAEFDDEARTEMPFSTAPQEQMHGEYRSDVDEEIYTELESSAYKTRPPLHTDALSLPASPSGTPTPAGARRVPAQELPDSDPSSPHSNEHTLELPLDQAIPDGNVIPKHPSQTRALTAQLSFSTRHSRKSRTAVTPEKETLDPGANADRSRSAKTRGLSTLHGLMEDANEYAEIRKREKRVKEKGKKRKDRDQSPFRHGDLDLLDEDAAGASPRKSMVGGPKRVKLGGLRGVGGFRPFGETVTREVLVEEEGATSSD